MVLEESDEEIEKYILSNKKLLNKTLKKKEQVQPSTLNRTVMERACESELEQIDSQHLSESKVTEDGNQSILILQELEQQLSKVREVKASQTFQNEILKSLSNTTIYLQGVKQREMPRDNVFVSGEHKFG